ncbi:MAG: NAD(P)-dependent malic enzyme [Cetobacterium sp.]|uniref:NAD(P)-dependent malic enzyme n=1 Tax=Cetobacterium sp. TaxID=2071632 RepID=UPI003F32DED9
MNVYDKALEMHAKLRGKYEVVSKVDVNNKEQLSLAYSPGVAAPCLAIKENKEDVYKYTAKGNMVAVISDGSAILGLGNIGPEAGLPVMESKVILYKDLAGIDSFPLCLDTQDTEELIKTIKYLVPTFGAIHLEDLSCPKCIEVETRLKEELDIPVFHNDQHGTSVVAIAGLINAFKLVNKTFENSKFVINGAEAAGSAITKLLVGMGAKNILLVSEDHILNREENSTYDFSKKYLSEITNPTNMKGTLRDAMVGADVFIGVSKGNVVDKDMVKSMNSDAIVFAMANPTPEIMPEDAYEAGAKIVGTGRGDYPNQLNNVLAYPGIFRGALDAKATKITEEMKMAAAYGIAKLITDDELAVDNIIPKAFDKRVVEVVAKEVVRIAQEQGVIRK